MKETTIYQTIEKAADKVCNFANGNTDLFQGIGGGLCL